MYLQRRRRPALRMASLDDRCGARNAFLHQEGAKEWVGR